MPAETILTNAKIVTPEEIVDGHLVLIGGEIAEIGEGRSTRGEDMGGDFVIPGLVELHTDHIEGHYHPRPRVVWNRMAAIQAHDAQIAASGITTVFDALRVGTDENRIASSDDIAAMGRAIGQAVDEDRVRADHFIHLRCEVSAEDVVEGFDKVKDNPRLRLASLMDHAPGQRQFRDLDAYRAFYQKKDGLTDAEFDAFCERRIAESEKYAPASRRAIAAACRERGIALASHDDASAAHVAESVELGIAVAEFPTTVEAAEASRAAGLHILMGAPNIVRGGSHSGNVSALELMRLGVLDILSSDYVPFSMLQAAFHLYDLEEASLPEAIRHVTKAPAEAVGLADRGAIEPGRRADLVRIRAHRGEPPVVRSVFREGRRVA
ncbi:alpha-D-ribose 1-methylphosphonate 5-triphosphate diphosphatase [Aurantimonas sp. VKM B-3413]|uniref:alpha-D-ribose 1-methylphosphonate 5-triphosphate diphosphatase n=1 Tax=Aurantimonas sp. VKM B-3413 TaxID=2779401 RepID=UPI001E354331|nr:alpha-D-ribose 1-methylphosphonate 5-triphosphate diphosphatase [Aurantimonas sp. VKM B-3413]MCB8838903.1 alpha-D-ribose 1-methylphosphonate 5-triphosphate diphosphatase [Aurantimonas sp. VKM B-3413]